MIEVQNLSKRFGAVLAVEDISFAVERGEVLGFLGPNGAGKSTTMRMITGYLTPDSGSVKVAGTDYNADSIGARRRIGYLPEGAPLYGDMTPRSFLRFIADIRGIKPQQRAAQIDEVVQKIQIAPVMDRPIETLSKGFKRRVGLAQAILHDPEVLILDEPTDGLDPNQKHEVRNLIRSMAADKVIILSTHILEEVDAVCTRAIIIADGSVIADGTPEALAARSQLHNAVTMSVRGEDVDKISGKLNQLEGVRDVQVLAGTQGVMRFVVRVNEGASVVSEVGEAVRINGWVVEELHVERGQLDEVFRNLTTGVAKTEEVES